MLKIAALRGLVVATAAALLFSAPTLVPRHASEPPIVLPPPESLPVATAPVSAGLPARLPPTPRLLALTATPAPPPPPPPPREERPSLASIYAAAGLTVPDGPVDQPGCPPPPAVPSPPETEPPWRPPVTVPEDALPEPVPPGAWQSSPGPISGKGMWIWQWDQTEQGDMGAVVDRAVRAGLEQLWVRVGDSRYGFYGARWLEQLVPLAHARGLAVIGWGFPFLHDPEADASWGAAAVAWRGPDGRGLDAFSPDIETSAEGVTLTARRVAVYLGRLRQSAGSLPIVATVYPPSDWLTSDYPFETIAAYADAFAPMVYWYCEDPGEYAAMSIERLRAYGRPVHVIGQAYGETYHDRRVPPSGAETLRFLDTAVREGALGASFWVWQHMGGEQWEAFSRYPWRAAAAVASQQ